MFSRLFPDLSPLSAGFPLFDYKDSGQDETAQWLRWNEYKGHLGMVLLKVDRASMHHSLEVRVPFLDREVIDIAARVDWRSCLDLETKTGKQPLRRALSRHVRSQSGDKRGFEVPMHAWLRGPLKTVFEDCVLNRREILGVPVSQKEVRNLFRRHLAGADHAAGLWTLLSLAFWEERHYKAYFN